MNEFRVLIQYVAGVTFPLPPSELFAAQGESSASLPQIHCHQRHSHPAVLQSCYVCQRFWPWQCPENTC
jgi:hypothetical protein